MNKKKITLMMTSLLVASSILTGCGSSNNSNDKKTAVAEDNLRRVSDTNITAKEGQKNTTGTSATTLLELMSEIVDEVGIDNIIVDGVNNIMNGKALRTVPSSHREITQGTTTSSEENIGGKITPVASSGGVYLTGTGNAKKPQGMIKLSFKLSGDVLDTDCSTYLTASGTGLQDEFSSTPVTLNQLIQKAYF